MTKDMRIRVAGALMIAVVSVLASAQAHAATPPTVRYACEERQNLTIQRDATTARVTFIDRSYELQRRRSSIGVKYGSPSAALIIDGKSAVFVADDRLQLGACTEAFTVASR
jgi:membrane-bound inhibitor of C-type lysozyme